jgi:hypothetical protein
MHVYYTDETTTAQEGWETCSHSYTQEGGGWPKQPWLKACLPGCHTGEVSEPQITRPDSSLWTPSLGVYQDGASQGQLLGKTDWGKVGGQEEPSLYNRATRASPLPSLPPSSLRFRLAWHSGASPSFSSPFFSLTQLLPLVKFLGV